MSSVLKFTDVPEDVLPEDYVKQLDKKKEAEDNALMMEEQEKLDKLTEKSNGGTEQMLRRLKGSIDQELLDKFQVICSRVRWIDPDKKTILWLHDLPGDPESQHLSNAELRKRFDGIVCVSDWQMQQYNNYLGLPYKDSIVLKNAIEPVVIEDKPFDGVVKLIYHTTPHRGLELVVPVFESLWSDPKYKDKIQLDVYSSFSIYGWDERDEPYKGIFDRCKEHPAINYHGYQPREKVIEALKEAHVFAFPSIWPETSCLSAIEAMSARCLVVCPNLAALSETTNPWSYSYQYSEDKQDHANKFGNVLASVIDEILDEKTRKEVLDSTANQKKFIDSVYNWDTRAQQWEQYMRSLL